MADSDVTPVSVITITAAVGAVVLLFVLLCNIGRKEQKKKESGDDDAPKKTEKSAEKVSGQQPKIKYNKKSPSFQHPWLCCTLKGHTKSITSCDFSPNGKYFLTASEDRSLMLWSTKNFSEKDHKSVRGAVEFDHATKVAFSPDSKAFLTVLATANALRIFRIGKKEDTQAVIMTASLDFPQQKKSAEIIHVGISSNGRFIMTCHSDTTLIIWNIKGEILTTIDTRQMQNSFGAVSNCGRFVGSAGFTPDVKVWEIHFEKNGSYKETKRAFELKGHSAGVLSFSFNNDSSRMASASKDGTWKFWDTDVKYAQNQDPKLISTGMLSCPSLKLISLSPDARTVAIAGQTEISIRNTVDGKEEQLITNIHSECIEDIKFDITGKFLVSIGDRHVQVFHNVVGYRALLTELTEKERTAPSNGIKERLRAQMKEARSSLADIMKDERNGHTAKK